jgi:hypothetical protein
MLSVLVQYTAVPAIHSLGAVMALGVGIAYCWIQVALTAFTVTSPYLAASGDRPIAGKLTVGVRVAVSVIATAMFVVGEIFVYRL